MNPAWSVVFLTTLIGAGQGLFIALYAADVGARLGLTGVVPDVHFLVGGALLSVVLGGLGLVASFFHLGRPARAWRSAAMWRTSWLSREVIALPLFIAGVAAYAFLRWQQSRAAVAIGALALIACLALFVCTAMIYACIRFLQEWASPLTVINFLLLGCASGFTLATAVAALLAPDLAPAYAWGAGTFTAVALLSRVAALRRNARLKHRSSLQTAIGIRNPKIAQKSQGFTGSSFNTREFFHGVSRMVLGRIKWLFIVLVFPVPLVLMFAGLAFAAPALLIAAFAVQYVGLLAERWFFLAQANHPQNLYYQAVS